MTFRQHVEQVAVRALAEFPAEAVPAIYTVTFRIDCVDQDPRFPYLAIGYNTETEVARLLASPSPPDAWEARWNYAYFPPSGLEGTHIAGHDHVRDPAGAESHRREAVTQGLWYEDADDLSEQERDERGEQLEAQFHALCVDVARRLHGQIAKVIGRPVPVVLYDMFNPDEMFALTKAANPAELVAEFLTEDPG
ncbi:hypothetical protein GCM10027176_21570 [Actinoallomurus bryophytorum]|uniref:Uncharacterized protein n=1 Tax=Actinoallomurus bryophytorum TaxID=1490222 RepID=A0A543CKE5_9ACTN|nr:hypothetical protein [Actinoallomurus bryophytorum]TQL97574.1 hypothetical protein FB559_3168 [Actinoallomurus bryophytorum]